MPQYDEIEIEDMTYDPQTLTYSYPCPCGDRFKVTLEDLWDGDDIADCNSCTLYVQVIYEECDLPPLPEEDSDDEEEENGESVKENEEKKEESTDRATPAAPETKQNGEKKDDDGVTLGMGKLSIERQESGNSNSA
ncbi:MAG: hypothetical protein SGARI_002133, partial [Bacillariaceae sp.]